ERRRQVDPRAEALLLRNRPLHQRRLGEEETSRRQTSRWSRLAGLRWFLIEADDVPARIAEPPRDFRRINAEGLDDRSPRRANGLPRSFDAFPHDAVQQAR